MFEAYFLTKNEICKSHEKRTRIDERKILKFQKD